MMHVGFIGVGGISAVHLNYLKTRKDVHIAALCDIRSKQLAMRQKDYGGAGFTDFRKMLETTRLDAVWICTPPSVRKEPLLACADRRIPVFCEKPVEYDEAKGRAIAAALARRKARVQIGYVFRSVPVVEALRQVMRDDTPHMIQSFYGCGVSLSMSLSAWFYLKARSGGALIDQATHNLDLLRFLFGEVRTIHGLAANPVRKKTRRYTIDETLGLVFQFRNGMIGTHNHTWVGHGWKNEIVISGEKRLYRLNLNTGCLSVEGALFRSDSFRGLRAKASERGVRVKASAQTKKSGSAKASLIPDAGAAGRVVFQQDGASIYVYENQRFLKQVISGHWSRNPSDYADGLKTLQLTWACDRAVTRGKAVVIP